MSPKHSEHPVVTNPVNTNQTNEYRRKFLAQSAAVAGLAIAPGLVLNQVAHAKADADKASAANRWGYFN